MTTPSHVQDPPSSGVGTITGLADLDQFIRSRRRFVTVSLALAFALCAALILVFGPQALRDIAIVWFGIPDMLLLATESSSDIRDNLGAGSVVLLIVLLSNGLFLWGGGRIRSGIREKSIVRRIVPCVIIALGVAALMFGCIWLILRLPLTVEGAQSGRSRHDRDFSGAFTYASYFSTAGLVALCLLWTTRRKSQYRAMTIFLLYLVVVDLVVLGVCAPTYVAMNHPEPASTPLFEQVFQEAVLLIAAMTLMWALLPSAILIHIGGLGKGHRSRLGWLDRMLVASEGRSGYAGE